MNDLARIANALERIACLLAAQQASPAPCPLLAALRTEYATAVFSAREGMERAKSLQDAADLCGQRLPDLPHELARAKISTVRGFARWLADRQGRGIEKAGTENGAAIWAVDLSGFESLSNDA